MHRPRRHSIQEVTVVPNVRIRRVMNSLKQMRPSLHCRIANASLVEPAHLQFKNTNLHSESQAAMAIMPKQPCIFL